MRKVCRELKWTDEDYSRYQYETGIAYLTHYLNHDEYSIQAMERHRIFWNWWKNHWTNRDEKFMEQVVNTTFSVNTQRELYNDMHDAETLARCIYPNGVVLNETYADMVTELVKHETETT
jgi:hypothetical protein